MRTLLIIFLLIGLANAIPPAAINWSQMLPEDANIILNGGDIQGQPFATEYDVIVYPTDDGDVKAIYGGNRTPIDSGTIGSTVNTRVIRAGINATPNNGTILIAGGPYDLLANLNCTTGDLSYVNYYYVALPVINDIHIKGMGTNATILRLAPSQYDSTHRGLLMYDFCPFSESGGDGSGPGHNEFSLEDLTLDGNVEYQTPYYHDGAGLFLSGSMRYNTRIRNVEFRNSPNHALYLGYNGGGWENHATIENVYCHDNWGSSQIDNTENLALNNFMSKNDSWGMWSASRKALAIDGMYDTSGNLLANNIHIIDGSLYIFGFWKSRDDLSMRLSNIFIDSRDVGKHGIYIYNCNNVTIADGRVLAGTASYAASIVNSTGITFDDLELRGLRGFVVETGYRSDIKLDGCDINTSGDCFRVYGAGSTALLTGCDLNTSNAAAYMVNVQAGAKTTLLGCHGSDNGLIYVSSSSDVLEHSGTSGLGLEAYGATSVADGGTIAHGMKIAPTFATSTGSLAGTTVTVTAKNATHLTIDLDGVTTTQTVYWWAKY